MFEGLGGKLGDIFDKLKSRGALKEADVAAATREVRIALLEADVALSVVKEFVEKVRERAVGQEVIKSVSPGQQVVKIVHDNLVEMLGSEAAAINTMAVPPVPILIVGLQGSGKTTSTAKIGRLLTTEQKKKVLMASLDVQRPAAQEQLRVLGLQAEVATLPIVPGQGPVDIARRAISAGKLNGYDVVLLDTAGRLSIDEALMAEVAAVRDAVQPVETLLVADAMTGQDAVATAENFKRRIGLTGIVLTRVDGDARGGAALSMRAVTGCPIKLIGVGEKIDAIEPFHPERIAGRILGMGDVVSLVEKARQVIDEAEAEKMAAKVTKGDFDLEDLLSQLRQLKKMGGLGGLMGMLPGIGKLKKQMAGGIDEKVMGRQEAIILSMTAKERKNPKILHASRKRRIAGGSGTTVQDVNKLLKQHADMAKMMKRVGKLGPKGLMRGGLGQLMGGMGGGGTGGPGGLPPGFPRG